MSVKEKIIVWCDKTMAFSFYALIYFLPISIALAEFFTVLSLVAYLIKRLMAFLADAKRSKTRWFSLSLSRSRIVYFFKAFKPVDNYLNVPIAAFLFFSFVSVLISQHPSVSWEGFFGKTLQSAFIYFTFIECINSRRRLKIFLNVFFVSCALITMNGFYQSIIGQGFIHGHIFGGRVSSSFRHANDYSAYLVVVIPILLSILLSYGGMAFEKNKGRNIYPCEPPFISQNELVLCFVLFVGTALSLGLTFSRGGWFGFLVSMLYLGYRKKKFIMIVGFVLILFFAIFYPKQLDSRKIKLNNGEKIEQGEVSKENGKRRHEIAEVLRNLGGSGRILYWEEALNMIKDKPLFGVGLNAYSLVARKYKITWGGYPHNCYLQMLSEIGIAGFLCFLWILFRIYVNTAKAYAKIENPFWAFVLLGSAAGLAGFLAQSFFDTSFYSVQLGSLLWVMMGFVVSMQRMDVQDWKVNTEHTPSLSQKNGNIFHIGRTTRRICLFLLICSMLIFFYAKKVTRNPRYGLVFFDLAVNCKGCSWGKKIKYFQNAIYHNPDLGVAYYEMGQLYEIMGDKERSFECFLDSVEKNPSHLESLIKVGELYVLHDRPDYALRYLKLALTQDIVQPEASYYLGLIHEENREYDKAMECYKNVHFRSVCYVHSLVRYGAILHQVGRDEHAISVIGDLRAVGRGDLADQLQDYVSANKFPEFINEQNRTCSEN
ncbi:MAG: O-antigen ligase family protein [Candidatus Omnitrophica bacterium]|nr:O-antigen ligase family protein [Candidatus Omnitrophota bacterium]